MPQEGQGESSIVPFAKAFSHPSGAEAMQRILNTNVAPPTYRYLLGYALDPGFSTKLDTAPINVVVYKVPFEDLEPGPIGQYLEVMDFDPASKCWYEPVDLRDERVASQQGLTPSERNPQFHQQFVYA